MRAHHEATDIRVFEFRFIYNVSMAVFPLADDYSFGILQSGIHWEWFTARCSTMKADWRYTSNTVFDSFPWPQNPSRKAVEAVAKAAVALRKERSMLLQRHNLTLRELYRTLDKPGSSPMRVLQGDLDTAVKQAYEMPQQADGIAFLLALNQELAAEEARGVAVVGPGLPPRIPIPKTSLRKTA